MLSFVGKILRAIVTVIKKVLGFIMFGLLEEKNGIEKQYYKRQEGNKK